MKSASTMEAETMNQTDELTRQMNELIIIVKKPTSTKTQKVGIGTVVIDTMYSIN